jgi:GTP cyclohydrolase II
MDILFGTTLFMKKELVELEFGTFEMYFFKDTITKAYIIALRNDFDETDRIRLVTRIHSSCITSEMMNSMDCDCVEQLRGALHLISKEKGILFYLIQEGRGCGYLGKARACQIVQYNENRITTFDAYHQIGMKSDYRSYHNIYEIIHILGLQEKKFTLLTNNPDKVHGMKMYNVNIDDIKSIEFEPNPYNRSYLVSKEAYGHALSKTNSHQYNHNLISHPLLYPLIAPFKMRALSNPRYYHVASYYLPIQINGSERSSHVIEWLLMNLYYDTQLNTEFIFLSTTTQRNKNVFIHPENIVHRFPLNKNPEHNKFKTYQENIMKNNGTVILYYQSNYGICPDKVMNDLLFKSAIEIANIVLYEEFESSIRLRIENVLNDREIKTNVIDLTHLKKGSYVSGMGSSRYHAMFLADAIDGHFIEMSHLRHNNNINPADLILVSQGVNPFILDFISKHHIQLIVCGDKIHAEKVNIIQSRGIPMIQFKADHPDDTLARITGIYNGFQWIINSLGYNNKNTYTDNGILDIIPCSNQYRYYFVYMNHERYVEIIANMLSELYACDISYIGNYIEFVHGSFQASCYHQNCVYFVFGQNESIGKVEELLSGKSVVYFTNGNICDWILRFLKSVYDNPFFIHQKNWLGKEKQSEIYNEKF